MLRIYHTLWTAPMTREKVHSTMLCFACSYYFAKRMGAQVVLHADTPGAAMLSAIPYDEVYRDLNDLPRGIAPFWAFGKLYATAREPLGSIHIDGDVFLKNPKLAELFDGKYDLLVQSEEGEKWRTDNTYQYSQQAVGEHNLMKGLHIDYPLAWNAGVTQFMNQELKDTYTDMYFNTVARVLHDDGYSSRVQEIMSAEEVKGNVIPDIIVEQQCLHELTSIMNKKVKCILNGDIQEDAARIGYAHLLAAAKYNRVDEIEDLLKRIAPDMLAHTKENEYWKYNAVKE